MNQSNAGKTHVVVLDDDADTRFAIGRILRKCGCVVSESESVEDTISQLQTTHVDVVFSDLRLPGADGGEELLTRVTSDFPLVSVVLMSCAMDKEMSERYEAAGAAACVQKPFYKDTCIAVLEKITSSFKKSA